LSTLVSTSRGGFSSNSPASTAVAVRRRCGGVLRPAIGTDFMVIDMGGKRREEES
jgi:hypothetical protein